MGRRGDQRAIVKYAPAWNLDSQPLCSQLGPSVRALSTPRPPAGSAPPQTLDPTLPARADEGASSGPMAPWQLGTRVA